METTCRKTPRRSVIIDTRIESAIYAPVCLKFLLNPYNPAPMPDKENNMLKDRNLASECVFIASRSSGPGGQSVNKVSSRVTLRFDLRASALLSEEEKALITNKLTRRITSEGMFILSAQKSRSQFENKAQALEKFYTLLENALTPVRKRRPTRPTASSKVKRLELKQLHARKKSLRKREFDD